MLKKLIVIFFLINSAHGQVSVSPDDFNILIGDWTGKLTYLDYSSGKSYSMPAEIKISQSVNPDVFILKNIYPDEPDANSYDTIVISEDGSMINEETVALIQTQNNGNKKIITEYESVDGNENKPALIRITYTIGEEIFRKRKDVKFDGQKEWIKRHEYRYERK